MNSLNTGMGWLLPSSKVWSLDDGTAVQWSFIKVKDTAPIGVCLVLRIISLSCRRFGPLYSTSDVPHRTKEIVHYQSTY